MATVYIETSIIGYMTARASDAVIFLARQQLTQEWWADQRGNYDLVTSQLVIDEAVPAIQLRHKNVSVC